MGFAGCGISRQAGANPDPKSKSQSEIDTRLMAVSYRPSVTRIANWADNRPRWDGESAGHYEVWFVTLNHRASHRGFWMRYTIDSPLPSALHTIGSNEAVPIEPRAALWAGYFDRSRPGDNFVIRQYIDDGGFRSNSGETDALTLAGGSLSGDRATGEVESESHRMSWDLSFIPSEATYHHVNPAMSRFLKPSSFILSPNLASRFTGTVIVDGTPIRLENEPGCQTHLWGRKRLDEWVWVHSNAFERHPETVFEGLAGRPKRAGRMLPPIYSLFLRHRGEEHRFMRLRLADQWQRRLGMGYWSFTATSSRLHIDGVAQCRLRDMLQVEYRDPDGEPLYCINSEVANLKLRLFKRVHAVRWRHVETINAPGMAHLEHACRTFDPDVRRGC